MTCPKCHGEMRTYERNGVHVDQCTQCGGLFLDRGELERLTAAESAHYAAPAPAAPRYEEPRYEQPRHGGHQPPHKRRKNFLEELFD
jgi:Zn-finger nucleic acid-binding protein